MLCAEFQTGSGADVPGPAEGGGDTNCIRPLVNSRKTNSGQIFGRSERNVFVQEAAESAKWVHRHRPVFNQLENILTS